MARRRSLSHHSQLLKRERSLEMSRRSQMVYRSYPSDRWLGCDIAGSIRTKGSAKRSRAVISGLLGTMLFVVWESQSCCLPAGPTEVGDTDRRRMSFFWKSPMNALEIDFQWVTGQIKLSSSTPSVRQRVERSTLVKKRASHLDPSNIFIQDR
jgi:hypothetical protein